MKRHKLLLTAALAIVMSASAFTGCVKKNPAVSADTLQIAVVARGYGSEFAKELARAYTRKTKTDAQVVKESTDFSIVENSLILGPRSNKIDLYFALENNVFNVLAQGDNVVDNYDKAWADLSEVYESPAAGYKESEAEPGLKVKDIFDSFAMDSATYNDGKQYSVPWSIAVEGMLYNKTLWDKVSAKPGVNISLPKTTTEMFKLFDDIKAMPSATRNGAYAFAYSGTMPYLDMLFYTWWPQYAGKTEAYSFYEGKLNPAGEYTYEIFNTPARLKAFETVGKLVTKSNGYTDPDDDTKDFTQSQLDFLSGNAFFSVNGDWLEQEASSKFMPGEADIAFMKIPVVSSIIGRPEISPYISNDAQLRQALDYIDGDTGVRPSFLTDDEGGNKALQFLRDARAFNTSACTEFPILVPAYAAHKKEAIDFIKFVLSKEGQEIMMETAYGTMSPIRVDVKQFDYYNPDPIGEKDRYRSTYMCNSKWEIWQNSTLPMTKSYNKYPIQYLGGMTTLINTSLASLGGDSPTTPAKFMSNEYDSYKLKWNEIKALAGLN